MAKKVLGAKLKSNKGLTPSNPGRKSGAKHSTDSGFMVGKMKKSHKKMY